MRFRRLAALATTAWALPVLLAAGLAPAAAAISSSQISAPHHQVTVAGGVRALAPAAGAATDRYGCCRG